MSGRPVFVVSWPVPDPYKSICILWSSLDDNDRKCKWNCAVLPKNVALGELYARYSLLDAHAGNSFCFSTRPSSSCRFHGSTDSMAVGVLGRLSVPKKDRGAAQRQRIRNAIPLGKRIARNSPPETLDFRLSAISMGGSESESCSPVYWRRETRQNNKKRIRVVSIINGGRKASASWRKGAIYWLSMDETKLRRRIETTHSQGQVRRNNNRNQESSPQSMSWQTGVTWIMIIWR